MRLRRSLCALLATASFGMTGCHDYRYVAEIYKVGVAGADAVYRRAAESRAGVFLARTTDCYLQLDDGTVMNDYGCDCTVDVVISDTLAGPEVKRREELMRSGDAKLFDDHLQEAASQAVPANLVAKLTVEDPSAKEDAERMMGL